MSIYKNKHFDVTVECLFFFPFIFLVTIDFLILSGSLETNFSQTRCHCTCCVNKQLYYVVNKPSVLLNNAKGCSITFLASTINWDFWLARLLDNEHSIQFGRLKLYLVDMKLSQHNSSKEHYIKKLPKSALWRGGGQEVWGGVEDGILTDTQK